MEQNYVVWHKDHNQNMCALLLLIPPMFLILLLVCANPSEKFLESFFSNVEWHKIMTFLDKLLSINMSNKCGNDSQ